MSDMNTSGWPFSEDTSGEELNIHAIFTRNVKLNISRTNAAG